MGRRSSADMKALKEKFRVVIVVTIAICIGLAGVYGLLKPISNGCVMTYMYPTYIPVSTPKNVSLAKYGLYLYHEGWRKIDFDDHLKNLNGVPVLFIPGNGGSYKQVRSLGAESDRAYEGGPLDWNFYQTSPSLGEGVGIDFSDVSLPSRYTSMLDWFAVDLEGEHSAMDGRILQEHTEYVVYAIHRVLDLYKESRDMRSKEGASISSSLPQSVILVGHSMGGFVARAALVHPHLREFAVETILTLSTPHQSPPAELQPSLSHYYAKVNQAWRKGYEVRTFQGGQYLADPLLSHVVIVSISGGYNDYQVRTRLESLDGIVPPTHGFMISSTGMKNVWLSMEHQVILWCNQLVVQVSHTLLSLIDTNTGKPFGDVRQRLGVFVKMLDSGIPRNFFGSKQLQQPHKSGHFPNQNGKVNPASVIPGISSCPSSSQWSEDGLEKDLYIQTSTISVLAMDTHTRTHVILATLTTFCLQTVSGRPPPAASMGVGQFFNPKDGEHIFSSYQMIHSLYSEKDMSLKEDHPLALNLTFSVSLGLLPVSLSLTTTGCGIKRSEFPIEESGDEETSRLCRRRCFPPVALAWDAISGLHVFPNLYSETIVVDSSPALWTSSQDSDQTTVILLVDPHCSYRSTMSVSMTAAAGRFLLLYLSQISGLCFAVDMLPAFLSSEEHSLLKAVILHILLLK